MSNALTLSARRTHDCHLLAQLMRGVPDERKHELAAVLVQFELMQPKGIARFIAWLGGKRHKMAPHQFLALALTDPRMRSTAEAIIKGACRHAVHGVDTEDAESVGGYSQREMDIIAEAMLALNPAVQQLIA